LPTVSRPATGHGTVHYMMLTTEQDFKTGNIDTCSLSLLYRTGIPPFTLARDVFANLRIKKEFEETQASYILSLKCETYMTK